MNPHDLNTRLTAQADQFERRGGTELDLGQVLDRAGEIRRGRRMRATMLMAACVLAIAVPTALVAIDRGHERAVQPARPSQVDRSSLTLDGLKLGDAPHVAYVQSGTLHVSDSTSRPPNGQQYVGVAQYAGGVMLAVRDARDNLTAQALGGDRSWPMEGDFAVSEGGKVVAFVKPDGTPLGIQNYGRTSYALPRIQRGTGFTAVAVTGEDCGPRPQATGCVVWVSSSGNSPETWTSASDGIAQRARTEFHTVTDVVNGDSVAGIVDVREDLTTCSAVERYDASTPTWTTCDFRFEAFSPDHQHLLATGSIGDGLGDTQLAVLDSTTGKVALDLKTADQVFIGQMVWEDDDNVLATVFQDGRWAVLRIALDGSREYAVAPVQGEDLDAPFVLASR